MPRVYSSALELAQSSYSLSSLRTSIVREASSVSLTSTAGAARRRRLENVFGHRRVGVQPGRNRAVSDAGRQRHQPAAHLVSRIGRRHAEAERPPATR